ncbi:MAG: acetoacetate decarboxylase [Hapalosiphonaceae cyanobacterium JJU2]|nr:MAG: acetoacetate decarboxylase [Hapalosiphonaceae cyanobacterium JJU2]
MSYPAAPWTLKGYALLTSHLLDVNRVRHLIPKELEIKTIWPGKTLGGVYLFYYSSESVLEYSELIVVSATVSYQGKIGGWVSHIYVDNPDSVAGGREIWGLPKELANFAWENNNSVTVHQGDRTLCSLKSNQPWFTWPQIFSGSSFSTMSSDLLLFAAELESRLSLVGSKLEVPAESPFAEISLGQPFATFRCDRMTLNVEAPQVLGQRIIEVAV